MSHLCPQSHSHALPIHYYCQVWPLQGSKCGPSKLYDPGKISPSLDPHLDKTSQRAQITPPGAHNGVIWPCEGPYEGGGTQEVVTFPKVGQKQGVPPPL